METRRYILAIGLSMLVLMTYFRFFAPQPPVEQAPPPEPQTAARETVQEKAPAPAKVRPAGVAVAIPVATQGREIVIETDVLKAIVNTAGGVITKWELKQYRDAKGRGRRHGTLAQAHRPRAGSKTETGAGERAAFHTV
jgi:YidC/Oxa1 family membrane protein insertase